jgi:hypothetical protein
MFTHADPEDPDGRFEPSCPLEMLVFSLLCKQLAGQPGASDCTARLRASPHLAGAIDLRMTW